jgi:hypothetical protein
MIPCVRPISLTSNGVFEASQDSGSEAAQDMRQAKTTLTGAAEVPGPGDPQGSGTLQLPPIPTKAKCVMS